MDKTLKKFLKCFAVCLFASLVIICQAFAGGVNQYGVSSSNPFVVGRFSLGGKSIDKVIVPGPPNPPAGYYRAVVSKAVQRGVAGVQNSLSNVPALAWSFGCSATSAAMMFGYYDNLSYINMYSGPTNAGVFPMTNASWGTTVINGETRALCPLSATRNNLDGRTVKGHVDDYWIMYDSTAADPFITGGWTEHAKGECTGDYMGTNQSSFSNTDGSTTFYNYTNGAPLYDFTGDEPTTRDGCHGMRLFAESRGYSVSSNYSQYIYGYNGNTQGFTFADFKAEIDAGRPVLIQLVGHTMLGLGYDNSTSTIYVHDTWDYSNHSMTWGGKYSGMQHVGVTVFRLASVSITTPTVTTTVATDVTNSGAIIGGNVLSAGGGTVTARGACWSTAANPTLANSCTSDGSGIGAFTRSISGLSTGTIYHVRAYATNTVGTAYGDNVQFVTLSPLLPTVATTDATVITTNSATTGGNVTSDGGGTVSARGVCWSMAANPTTSDACTNTGTGTGTFSSSISGLVQNTNYHFRAYAINAVGTAYGLDQNFTTSPTSLPLVTTTSISAVSTTTASGGGNVTLGGGAPVTAKGVCLSTAANPTVANTCTLDGTGTGSFSSSITGLATNSVYHVRAYATSSNGTSYGSDVSFTTISTPTIPAVRTKMPTRSITTTSASSGGRIISDGGSTITGKGVCWSTSTNSTTTDSCTNDGTGSGNYSSSISGLVSSTLFYVRAYATNAYGTAYGNNVLFKTGKRPVKFILYPAR